MADLTGSQQSQVESDLDAMYRTGRVIFPERARWAAAKAQTVTEALNTLNNESAKMADRACLEAPMQILEDIHKALTRVVNTFDDCAEGLVRIADGFVEREDYAAKAFKALQHDLQHNTPGIDVDDPTKWYTADKYDKQVAADPGKDTPKRVDVPGITSPHHKDGTGGVGEDPLDPGSKQAQGPATADQPEAEKDRARGEGHR